MLTLTDVLYSSLMNFAKYNHELGLKGSGTQSVRNI
jgi:hypothetical protein